MKQDLRFILGQVVGWESFLELASRKMCGGSQIYFLSITLGLLNTTVAAMYHI
jgi:hypothetical protein